MNHLPCPSCGQSLVDDGQQSGLLVACPRCGRQMQMPVAAMAFGAQPPPVPQSPPSYPPSPYRKRKRNAAKRLMIWVTVLWLCVCPLAYFSGRAAVHSYFKKSGGDLWIGQRGGFGGSVLLTSSEVSAIGSEWGWENVRNVTLGYFVLIGILGVVWFATKPD